MPDVEALLGNFWPKFTKGDPQFLSKSAKRPKNGHFIFEFWKICHLKSGSSRVKSGSPPTLDYIAPSGFAYEQCETQATECQRQACRAEQLFMTGIYNWILAGGQVDNNNPEDDSFKLDNGFDKEGRCRAVVTTMGITETTDGTVLMPFSVHTPPVFDYSCEKPVVSEDKSIRISGFSGATSFYADKIDVDRHGYQEYCAVSSWNKAVARRGDKVEWVTCHIEGRNYQEMTKHREWSFDKTTGLVKLEGRNLCWGVRNRDKAGMQSIRLQKCNENSRRQQFESRSGSLWLKNDKEEVGKRKLFCVVMDEAYEASSDEGVLPVLKMRLPVVTRRCYNNGLGSLYNH